VCAVEHQYLVTERTDRIPAGLPTLRDPDADVYVKPEPGALAVGGWEPNTRAWGAGGIAHDFGPELLPPDFDRFSPLAEEASERIPLLNEVGIRQMINGPIPITADGEPIIGLSPELDNFYLCCGFTSGIAASGGAGWVMANWIVDGDPGLDLWPFDVRRFGTPHSVKSFMYERAVESYARYYHIAWPNYDPDAGRGARRSPLHATLLGAGAVYGNKFGWERPNWFGEAGMHAVEVPSFGRGPAFEAIGAEHRAVRERVALIDMSSFSKYEVHGPGALALLQKIAGNDVDRPVGTIVYTQLCNERGGIEADVTITRLAADRFYFVTGSALGVRDRSTIERHMPHDGSVTIDDLTSARSVLNVTGPRSRDLLARLCDAPLDNLAFPYMSARPLDVGYAPVLALRVTYTGELGYELHVPIEYALYLYEKLWAAGEQLGIANAGYRAVNSLRLEKHYLAWGSDITPDYNPVEAGLGFCVALGKADGIARNALARVKAEGPQKRLTWFTATADVNVYGGEIVLAGRARAWARHERRLRLHRGSQHPVRVRRCDRAGSLVLRSRSDGYAIPRRAAHAPVSTIRTAPRSSRNSFVIPMSDAPLPHSPRASADAARSAPCCAPSHRGAKASECRARFIWTRACMRRDGEDLAPGLAFRRIRNRDSEGRRLPDADGCRLPVLVIRGDDGLIRAFHNVCRHRGSQICRTETGSVRALVCPYHSWTYSRQGELVACHGMHDGVDKSALGLRPVHAESCAGFIYVSLARCSDAVRSLSVALRGRRHAAGLRRARESRTSSTTTSKRTGSSSGRTTASATTARHGTRST
jgi:glycine cleavage system aminomethyltransferase T/nitrite reductase/ring-hydroxylating ferredoxin subunit